MNETISIILMIIGVLFNFFGCLGLIRFPDVYNRLQSATKCVTMGTWCILASLVVYFGFNEIGLKALIAIPLLFFAATVGAHALVRGSHQYGIKLWEKSVRDEYADDVNKEKEKEKDNEKTD